MDCYDVNYQGKMIGTIQLKPAGRYYALSCRCTMQGKAIHKLMADSPKGRICIGTLFPKDNSLYLERKVPMSMLKGITKFFIVSQQEKTLIQIIDDEAISSIELIRKMHFVNQYPDYGVFIEADPG